MHVKSIVQKQTPRAKTAKIGTRVWNNMAPQGPKLSFRQSIALNPAWPDARQCDVSMMSIILCCHEDRGRAHNRRHLLQSSTHQQQRGCYMIILQLVSTKYLLEMQPMLFHPVQNDQPVFVVLDYLKLVNSKFFSLVYFFTLIFNLWERNPVFT